MHFLLNRNKADHYYNMNVTMLLHQTKDIYKVVRRHQEVYIEELTRLSKCLNAKTGFVNF